MKRRFLAVMLVVLILLSAASVPVSAADAMRVSQPLIDILKDMEGFSKYPYADNGQWTVGYGTRCPDDKLSRYKSKGITEKEAEKLLQTQLSGFEDEVNAFAKKQGLTLKQHQFDALISFSFNCGGSWMRELTGFFNSAVRGGDLGNDLIYGLCLYSSSAGKYVLTKRRMCDANLYINGVYKSHKDKNPYPSTYRWVFLDGGAGKVRYEICGFDAALEEPIDVAFSSIPTGIDAEGNPFVYTLAGWYTSAGVKVEKLDSSLSRGQTLYAKWKNPEGKIVTPPAQTAPNSEFPRKGTVVNVSSTLNVRTGPGTDNDKNGTLTKGEKVTVLEEVTGGTYTAGGSAYNIWCKLADDRWVGKHYVQYDGDSVTEIKLLKKPAKTTYIKPVAALDPSGSVLHVIYANGYSEAMTVHRSMLSGFDGSKTGKQTVKISYGGKSVTYTVTVKSSAVTSSVYRVSGQYVRGITPGTTATQLQSGLKQAGTLKFYNAAGQLSGKTPVGTDTQLVVFDGSQPKATYTVIIRGDVNGDGKISKSDVTLLQQYVAGWDITLNELAADANGNGKVNGDDVTWLLRHIAKWKATVEQ